MISRMLLITCLCARVIFSAQSPAASTTNSATGMIDGNNVYRNPILQIEIPLPGRWHFFDRDTYSNPETKQKEKEQLESCRGPFCGKAEVDVAMQHDAPFVYAIFLTARPLPVEFQNRDRYPLKRLAQAFTSTAQENFVRDGELTEIQLGGHPAYRLNLHNKRTPTARAFAYVAESNGRIFMILGTAMSEPEKLRLSIESMEFQERTN